MEECRGFLWSSNCGFGRLADCYEGCKDRADREGESVSSWRKYCYIFNALMCPQPAVSDVIFKALQRQNLHIIQPSAAVKKWDDMANVMYIKGFSACILINRFVYE